MRGADGGPWDRICALPAVWVGLLYDKESLEAAEELAKHITFSEIIEATEACSKTGLKANIGKFKVQELAKELLIISKRGLQKRKQLDSSGQDETGFLSPLFSMAEAGETLADEMLESFYSNWKQEAHHAFIKQKL